jgi:4-carboxymuconolactone decarboxylase
MSRAEVPLPSEMTEAQRRVYEEVVQGSRARAPRPFAGWLKSPELARRAFSFGEFVRAETSLPPRLVQLAAVVVAGRARAKYLWATRSADALKAGLGAAAVEAIGEGREPYLVAADEMAVYGLARSLQAGGVVPEAVYRAAVGEVGERGVAELVAVVAYYTLVAMTLNAFDIGPPGST